jgi:hypothetical protein
VFSFKKKSDQNSENNNDLKEKLFFHDLVNQTHGLLLFLNQKNLTGAGIRSDEIQLIEKEIKTIQSLVRDHYNFKHKNLVQTYDWVPFSYAKLAFTNLSNNFLGELTVRATFTIQDESIEENLIYYPCFYRIVNNLVKNISEARCSEVEFHFLLNEKGLFIETKNSMKDSTSHSSESLARVILDEKIIRVKSMGLDSIHHLAEEQQGSFSFEIENNFWINKVFLPTKSNNSKIKTDKIAA